MLVTVTLAIVILLLRTITDSFYSPAVQYEYFWSVCVGGGGGGGSAFHKVIQGARITSTCGFHGNPHIDVQPAERERKDGKGTFTS